MPDFDNIVGRLLPVVNAGGWYWTEEGKLKRMPTGPLAEVPWIYNKMTFQCIKWHELFFKHVSGETMVHSHCHDCYKVVVSPRTVEELIALSIYQEKSGFECKCGIELRDFVKTKRLYGGYFYCRGVEAGRERYKQVEEWVHHIWVHGEFQAKSLRPMPVILKRGCTEFERALGPSDKYEITEEQARLEAAFEDIVDYDPFAPEGKEFPQPEVLKQYVRTAWLKWAHHHGDMTYLKFMPDGKSFTSTPMYYTPPPVTYHEP
jgi:hypothetical protein